jgi:hypothetical protein
MCTLGRLVQAGKTSEWFGMDHGNASQRPLNMRLTGGKPAHLEVTIDPAAHGPAGIGPVQRVVIVTTAGGERIPFTVLAEVTP